MKHLKLFEELKENEFVEQVKDVFLDLIDDDEAKIEDDEDWSDYDIVISFNLPNADIETISYNKFIQKSKLYYEYLNNINSLVERLKIHSDYDFTIDFDLYQNSDETVFLILMFKEGEYQVGKFYKKELNDTISLDKSELKEILNLNKTFTKINLVSGSYGKRLRIEFVNNTTLEEYKESLIVDIRKLKIEGKQFIVPISWGGVTNIDFKIREDGKSIEFGINSEIELRQY